MRASRALLEESEKNGDGDGNCVYTVTPFSSLVIQQRWKREGEAGEKRAAGNSRRSIGVYPRLALSIARPGNCASGANFKSGSILEIEEIPRHSHGILIVFSSRLLSEFGARNHGNFQYPRANFEADRFSELEFHDRSRDTISSESSSLELAIWTMADFLALQRRVHYTFLHCT